MPNEELSRKKEVFFSTDSQFIGVKTKNNNYRIFKSKNGHLLCKIPIDYQDLSLSYGAGGFCVALAILDLASRKCMRFSAEACLHMCHGSIHLFEDDLQDTSKDH